MDNHIQEAKEKLIDAVSDLIADRDQRADFCVRVAQAHALISIAESLQTLAAAVRDSAIDVHEVK